MANELKIAYDTGSTLYCRVFNSTGQVWNTAGTPAFETWAGGNVTDYDVALTDKSSGEYLGTFPTGITSGTYSVIVYLQAGGSPATGDTKVSSVGTMAWNGSAEVVVADDVSAILADTNELQSDDVPGLISTLDAVVDTVKAETALIVADTNELQTDWADGGRLDLLLDTSTTTGTDRGTLLDTTIATLASQTSFTLTAGSADNDAYNTCYCVIEDASTATQKAIARISDYTGATKTVTLAVDPGTFTMAATDKVYILARTSYDSMSVDLNITEVKVTQ